MSDRLTRRRFLRMAAGGVAVGAGTAAAPRLVLTRPGRGVLPRPRNDIQRIGLAYLQLRTREADVKVLRRKLSGSGISGPPREQLTAAKDRIAADFANSRTVMLSGWVLSVTEARLAALDLLTTR